jgi:hypothetical protein
MTRNRITLPAAAVLLGLLGILGLLSLTACGVAQTPAGTDAVTDAVEVAEDLPAEAQALAAMGFDVAEAQLGQLAQQAPTTAPTTTSSARPDRKADGHRRARVFLRRNVLHGEAVVQTKDGQKTIAVQRGTVTAITDTSVTVKSADGYTQTWTFGNPIHVVEHRTTIQPSAIKVGTEIGVAGAKEPSGYLARLIAKR